MIIAQGGVTQVKTRMDFQQGVEAHDQASHEGI